MAEVPAIGIDLGTTYSSVGIFQNGKVEIILNDQGNRTTSSYVAFTKTERLIGDAAKNQVNMNPKNTVFDVKRLIGRKYSDNSVQNNKKNWPFRIVPNNKSVLNNLKIWLFGIVPDKVKEEPKFEVSYKGELKRFYPEEMSSMILIKMKEIAEQYLGNPVTDAVVTVPACFNNSQREATKTAAKIAGFKEIKLLNGTTAAAITYSLEKEAPGKRTVLVFDLGSGTFDVSIITIEGGCIDVKATAGNAHLGGEDFDNRMVGHFVEEFMDLHEKNVRTDERAVIRLKTACEKAKRVLSVNPEANVEIVYLYEGIDFNSTITRDKFEEINADLFESVLKPVQKALKDANVRKGQIDDIVLVGGSTRIPKIEQLLRDFFDGKEMDRRLNREEAIAYGAAVQAAVLNGDKSNLLEGLSVQDVRPLALEIEQAGKVRTTLFAPNTKIPTTQTHIFTNTSKKSSIFFKVYEEENGTTKDDSLLGAFKLSGVPPALREMSQIEITFAIDSDGIINITSEVNESKIKNSANHNTKKRIKKMVSNKDELCKKDLKEQKRIVAKISLEEYAFEIKSTFEEDNLKDKLPKNEGVQVSNKIDEAIKWLDKNEFAKENEFNKKHRKLEKVWSSSMSKINQVGVPELP